MEYREGDRVLSFGLGFGAGDSWLLGVDTGHSWEPPFDHEELTAKKKEEILELVSEAIVLFNITVHFI